MTLVHILLSDQLYPDHNPNLGQGKVIFNRKLFHLEPVEQQHSQKLCHLICSQHFLGHLNFHNLHLNHLFLFQVCSPAIISVQDLHKHGQATNYLQSLIIQLDIPKDLNQVEACLAIIPFPRINACVQEPLQTKFIGVMTLRVALKSH